MEQLHLPDNIKVHFAGAEDRHHALIMKEMGISYTLYSAFPFIFKKVYGKKNKQDMSDVPSFLFQNFNHVIQDSGLYSLLFGSFKGKAEKKDVYKWYDALVDWTIGHGQGVTCVEVDAQSIIGVDEVWNLRERMVNDLPDNRIINVWHLEDGQYGLDRLIEFADYIAIGVPELKGLGFFGYVSPLANYIKRKKPQIDIHLLGCTDSNMIRKCRYCCTSSDSSFWIHPIRYGHLLYEKVSFLDTPKIAKMIGVEHWNNICDSYDHEENNRIACASIEKEKRLYEKNAGNQDYKN